MLDSSKIWKILLVLCLFNLSFTEQDNSPLVEILKKSDFYRGGQVPGVTWDLAVQNIENGQTKEELSLKIEAASIAEQQFALISFLAPKKYNGQKLLLRGNSMWFYKRGLRQPFPISSRQRLTGSAANADVASTNYSQDYDISSHEEVDLDGDPCWLLDLTANNNMVSYAHIKYWIRKKDNLGLKAEFYGKSMKHIKSARYKYENKVIYKTKTHPYISNILINDQVNKADQTILAISKPRFTEFNNSKFNKNSLVE